MNFLFRLLLTFNATSLLVIVFLVQKGCSIGYFFPRIAPYITEFPVFYSYLFYLSIPVGLTWVSIILCPLLGKDKIFSGEIVSIEHANNSFLPSYLGYFFVALSISSFEALYFVYGVLFVFTFLSQALYFNPLFLIYKFEFYNVTTKSGASIFLISRQKYKIPTDVSADVLYRINDYTFIEKD